MKATPLQDLPTIGSREAVPPPAPPKLCRCVYSRVSKQRSVRLVTPPFVRAQRSLMAVDRVLRPQMSRETSSSCLLFRRRLQASLSAAVEIQRVLRGCVARRRAREVLVSLAATRRARYFLSGWLVHRVFVAVDLRGTRNMHPSLLRLRAGAVLLTLVRLRGKPNGWKRTQTVVA